ncbi:MAG: hypothetical protein ABSG54_16925 [Terriglobia bacterium]|jgi:hypothetical protein
MDELSLTPAQVEILERLLRAGFRFLTLERYGAYFAVERDGFVALLNPTGGNLTLFSQAGYLIGESIGMLVEKPGGKAFVFHEQSVPATPELLAAYEQFKKHLGEILSPS